MHDKSRMTEEECARWDAICWSCRGEGGQHYESNRCEKHDADLRLYQVLRGRDVKTPDYQELAMFSVILDRCLKARVGSSTG